MWVGAITLFPAMFEAVTAYGVTGRAVEQGVLEVDAFNPRDYAEGGYRRVDDRPYGGGPGMVMMIEPLRRALAQAKDKAATRGLTPPVIYLSPQGRRLTQADVAELAQWPAMILLCGRYEGIDERLLATEVDAEWSVGDYVLSGGELPAMVLMDAITRLLPGVLGSSESAEQNSFSDGWLDCPHYTRPPLCEGLAVPDILLSGDHQAIARWRHRQRLERTALRRPDLLQVRALTKEEQAWLLDLRQEGAEVQPQAHQGDA